MPQTFLIESQITFSIFDKNWYFRDDVDDVAKENDINECGWTKTCIVELPAVVFEHDEYPYVTGEYYDQAEYHLLLSKLYSFVGSLK